MIAPTEPIKVKRLEGNVKKIRQLYEQGQAQAEEILADVLNYLEN